jgi:hypothetical protein
MPASRPSCALPHHHAAIQLQPAAHLLLARRCASPLTLCAACWGRCAAGLANTKMGDKKQHFTCPQHFCAACGKSGDGVDMVKCVRCPEAFHTSCVPKAGGVRRVKPGPKQMLCARHATEVLVPYMHPPLADPLRLQMVLAEARAQGEWALLAAVVLVSKVQGAELGLEVPLLCTFVLLVPLGT